MNKHYDKEFKENAVRYALEHEKLSIKKSAEKLVFEYIETFYNTVRIHSHCEYLSPNQYEDKYYLDNNKKVS